MKVIYLFNEFTVRQKLINLTLMFLTLGLLFRNYYVA